MTENNQPKQEVETQTTILQKKAGTYVVPKGNATPQKGWRTDNALSDWTMPKKQRIDSKGNTWEWDETPETKKALKKLHDSIERAKLKREDDDKGYDTYSK